MTKETAEFSTCECRAHYSSKRNTHEALGGGGLHVVTDILEPVDQMLGHSGYLSQSKWMGFLTRLDHYMASEGRF